MANSIVDMLRKKNDEDAALSSLKNKAEFWQGQQQNVQPATVQTPGNYGGAPAPTPVNYGGILQNAVSTFMGARSQKKYEEAKARNEAASQQFMMDTLKDDPEAQRLAVMAQYGVPGAEKALSERIAPQKEKLVNLQQNAKTLPRDMTPEVAAEYAKLYNVSPEMVISISDGYWKGVDDEANLKQKNAIELQGIKDAAAAARTGSRNAATLQAANIRNSGSRTGAKGSDGKVNYVADLTPGELQIRGKEMRVIDDKLQTSESQLSRFEPMMADISKISDQDWNKQAAAKLAAEKGGGVGELLGERMKNNAVKQLENYLMSTVLDRMSQLGGNDSNEELQRMRADLPSVYNSKEAAVQMLNRINQWQKSTNEAIKLRRQAYSDGSYFRDPTPRNFYREAYDAANPKSAPGGYQAPQGWEITVE